MDKPGTFAAESTDAGMFYQWNRNVGWSATYPRVNSNGGTTWDSSTPSNVPWEVANDPCPIGWRIPFMGSYERNEEFFTLFDTGYVSNVWSSANGMTGRKFTDRASGNSIFLPAAGVRGNYLNSQLDIISGSGEQGCYWSGTLFTWFFGGIATNWYGCYWFFNSDSSEWRAYGGLEDAQSVRCVAVGFDITVNEKSTEPRGNKFYAEPVENGDTQAIVYVIAEPGNTIAIDGVQQNPRTVDLPNYGDNSFIITVMSSIGGGRQRDYTLIIERYYEKVAYEYPDVPTINCNQQTNGGLSFTGFQWYRAGEVIDEATGPYYQVKDNAVYHCELSTSNNVKIRTINILPQSLHK